MNVKINGYDKHEGNLADEDISTVESFTFFLSNPTDAVTPQSVIQYNIDGKISNCRNSFTGNSLRIGVSHQFIFSATDESGNKEYNTFNWRNPSLYERR